MTDTVVRTRLTNDTKALPMQFRAATFERAAINEADRTVELSFSSEEPYERWFGTEILDHGKAAMRMSRLAGGAALLMDHNMRDQVGVVERAWIGDDRRGRAIVRFSKSARAQEVFQDVVDGIRSLVSVGYAVHEMVLERSSDTEEVYRVTDWEPYEISIVSVPADATVGVGRAAEGSAQFPVQIRSSTPPQGKSQGVHVMTDAVKDAPAGAAADPSGLSPDVARRLESQRCAALSKLGEDNNIESHVVRGWIEKGTSINDAAEDVLHIMEERGKHPEKSRGGIGMSADEVEQFSVLRAVQAVISGDWSKAGLEKRAHEALFEKLGQPKLERHSILIPAEVQARQIANETIARAARAGRLGPRAQRDLTVGTASAGGYLVETQNMGFIDLLRNTSLAYRMGATRLPGLQGNLTIPRQTGAGTAYWLSTEATQVTESQLTLGQVAMSPKTVGAYTEISRLLMLQSSPEAEQLVMMDLAQVVGLAVDAAVINGSGSSGQPTGILNTSGIGSVTGTSIALAGILEFQTDVAGANALDMTCGYATTPAVASLLIQRVMYSSTASPIWNGNILEGNVAGFMGMSSNQMPSATILFGRWRSVVVGEWGVLQLDVNPQANFQAGIIGIRAMYSVDVGVRYPGGFSAANSVT